MKVINGESFVTEIIDDIGLEKEFADILKKLKLKGHSVMQAIINEKGINIIECNPRFGGASTLSVKAGLDTFYWTILEDNGINIEAYPFIKRESIKKQVRYSEDFTL